MLERIARLKSEQLRAERSALGAERQRAPARATRSDLDALPDTKSAPEMVRLAAALKQSTLVNNAWLAGRLGMGEAASASQFVRRWLLASERRTATVDLLLSVET